MNEPRSPQSARATNPNLSDAAIVPETQRSQPEVQPLTLTVEPKTTITDPVLVQAGQQLQVLVSVQNSSEAADRLRLSCSGLNEDWTQIHYWNGLTPPNFAVPTKGLKLQPSQPGQIILLIQPPPNAGDGKFMVTLWLESERYPEERRSQMLHLQVWSVCSLAMELRTIVGQVTQGAGRYEIWLLNQSSCDRRISLNPRSETPEACEFWLTPAPTLTLLPGTSAKTDLRVKPMQRWGRPWWGEKPVPFVVDVTDQQGLPLLPDQLTGAVIWQGRPVWQILAGLGLVGASVAAIALIAGLWIKTTTDLKIVTFGAGRSTYEEGKEPVRLNWQIQNPQQLQTLQLTSRSEDGKFARSVVFDFSQGIPKELKSFCTGQQVLDCQGIPTDARTVGKYGFELSVLSKSSPGSPSDTQKTDWVSVQPQLPAIVAFKLNNKDAPEKYRVALGQATQVALSWQVKGGKDLQVELLPLYRTVATTGSMSLTLAQQPGIQTVTLKGRNSFGQEVSRSLTIETYAPQAAASPPNPSTPAAPPTATNAEQLPTVIPNLPQPAPAIAPPPQEPRSSSSASPAPAPKPAALKPNQPTPADSRTLSPSELPPQFN